MMRILFTLLIVSFFATVSFAQKTNEGPNVIIIYADDMGWTGTSVISGGGGGVSGSSTTAPSAVDGR